MELDGSRNTHSQSQSTLPPHSHHHPLPNHHPPEAKAGPRYSRPNTATRPNEAAHNRKPPPAGLLLPAPSPPLPRPGPAARARRPDAPPDRRDVERRRFIPRNRPIVHENPRPQLRHQAHRPVREHHPVQPQRRRVRTLRRVLAPDAEDLHARAHEHQARGLAAAHKGGGGPQGDGGLDPDPPIQSICHLYVQALGELSLRDVFPSSWVLRMVADRNDRRLKKLHAESDTILQEIIDAHVSRRRSDVDRATGGGDDQDLVDVLLNFTRDKAVATGEFSVTDFEIKAVITDIFFGGTHTSSVTIEWVMSELMRNPEEMEKAQKEVRRVFDGKGKAVDEASIDELHYMKLIVRETLRLHPPLPLLVPRESRETIVIKGYQIPAKTKVAINAWAIGRDPAYWIEPDKFMPERFVNSPVNYNGDDFQLLPFGAGRRMCPGVKTGMAIVHLAVANLLYHFDWKLPNEMKPEDLDMTEVFGIVVGRKNDLHLIPTPYRAP
ncbi:unnamed protein product [Linum tenue]|uniref:Cytochrome P450 n=1 Tax=Linum tenue TaxID=586396 RepID=A0AAV0S8N1_9ROSI|nr:unnamed protein product [Linum tenue]